MQKEQEEAEIKQRLAQMDAMQAELNTMRENIANAEEMRSQVQQLFEDGLLKQNQDGKFEAVVDPAESDQIRSEYAQASRQRPVANEEIQEINANLAQMQG